MKKLLLKYRFSILIVLLFFCTIYIRISFWNHVSDDIFYHVLNWCKFIDRHEGFSAFGHPFSDYPPLYTYLLAFIVKLTSIPWMTGIKLISSIFDYILAFFAFKIVSIKHGKSLWSILSACVISLLPTVLMNSSLWGQSDSIYTTLVVISVYYALTQKYSLAFIFYGLAFSFKVQAVFILPFFAVLYTNTAEVKLWHFSFIPLTFLITIMPCYVAGREFIELINIYANQTQNYQNALSHNAPNIYELMPNTFLDFSSAGIYFSASVVLIIVLIFSSKLESSSEKLIDLALMSVLLLPFFLPFMHERYFYLADIFAIIYVFYHKKNTYLLAIPLLSLFSYMPFLFHTHVIDTKILGGAMLLVVSLSVKNILYPHITSSTEASQ